MIEEIGALGVGLVIGVIITWAIDKKSNLAGKLKNNIHKRQLGKIINDPEALKERLEKNGELIDDGEKITYDIINGELIAKREPAPIQKEKLLENDQKKAKKTPQKKTKSKK